MRLGDDEWEKDQGAEVEDTVKLNSEKILRSRRWDDSVCKTSDGEQVMIFNVPRFSTLENPMSGSQG